MSDFAALTKAVEDATEAFKNADFGYNEANRRRTNALNTLNNAQKALDEAVTKMKLAAPRDTDWNRPRPVARAVA